MADKKVVIKGLEKLQAWLKHLQAVGFHGDIPEYRERELTVSDALALLREQEPVVHCKDCVKRDYDNCPFNEFLMYTPEDNFYCGEGVVKWNAAD